MAMKLRILALSMMIITGCEEVVDRPLLPGQPRIVVEGVLTNELRQHKVKIGWSYAGQDGTSSPVTGASVRVVEGSNVYSLTEDPVVPGEYLTSNMRAVFGREYMLHIQYQGQDYIASDSSVPVEPMAQIEYQEVTGGYVLTMNESGQDPNYIMHDITWYGTSNCDGTGCEGLVVFYDLKTVDVNEGTKPPKEEFVFPPGSTIVRRKYSVSAAYKSFLRAVMSETEWRGSAFDMDRANAPTNLSNGAIGFFAVTTVTMDSTVVE